MVILYKQYLYMKSQEVGVLGMVNVGVGTLAELVVEVGHVGVGTLAKVVVEVVHQK